MVYRIGHLGDTLVSLPAFWAIRNAFPEAQITFLTNVDARNPNYIAARSVLPEEGLFDDYLTYEKASSKVKTVSSYVKLFIEIRRRKFDCLYYLMTRNRTVNQIKRDERFFRLAGIENIFGTDYLAQNLLEEKPEKPRRKIKSELEFFLDTLAADDSRFDLTAKPEMRLTKGEKDFVEKWLAVNRGEKMNSRRLLAVAPGSKWDSKIWAEERFAEVVAKLIERENIFPVVFGGSEDADKGDRLLQQWKIGANAAGQLNVRQSAALLEKCCLYLGNDTGTMHLAASVGVPCVAVFAAIDWEGRWRPFGDKHVIFREKVACEGCHSPICPFEKQCLTGIQSEAVLAACENILKDI